MRSTQDVETISNFSSTVIISGMMLPLTLVVVVPAMLQRSVQWSSAVAGMLLAATILIILAIFRIFPYFSRTQVLYDSLNRTFLEYLDGLMAIRAYGSADMHERQFDKDSGALYSNDRSIQKIMSFAAPLNSIMSIVIPLGIYAVSLFVLPGLPQSEQMDMYSSMITVTMYALMILTAMGETMIMMGIYYPKYAV